MFVLRLVLDFIQDNNLGKLGTAPQKLAVMPRDANIFAGGKPFCDVIKEFGCQENGLTPNFIRYYWKKWLKSIMRHIPTIGLFRDIAIRLAETYVRHWLVTGLIISEPLDRRVAFLPQSMGSDPSAI